MNFLNNVDRVVKALDRGENTKGWDKGKDAGEPDDTAERQERLKALEELEEDA